MQPILNVIISVIVFLPLYVVLAANSLRYYASSATATEENIQSFLQNIPPILRAFYAEHSKYNLFVSDANESISKNILGSSRLESLGRRVFYSVITGALIIGSLIGLTKQSQTIWIIAYMSIVVIHSFIFIWAWRFGSKLIKN